MKKSDEQSLHIVLTTMEFYFITEDGEVIGKGASIMNIINAKATITREKIVLHLREDKVLFFKSNFGKQKKTGEYTKTTYLDCLENGEKCHIGILRRNDGNGIEISIERLDGDVTAYAGKIV